LERGIGCGIWGSTEHRTVSGKGTRETISKDRAIPPRSRIYNYFNELKFWLNTRRAGVSPVFSARRQDLPFQPRARFAVIASREYGLY
jgi:hypothetical protein